MPNYEVILSIVNAGFSDVVMDTAKKLGAGGGTVIHARGTATKEAEKILVPVEIKNTILKGLYDTIGIDTNAQGIAFSLPVDDVIGINTKK